MKAVAIWRNDALTLTHSGFGKRLFSRSTVSTYHASLYGASGCCALRKVHIALGSAPVTLELSLLQFTSTLTSLRCVFFFFPSPFLRFQKMLLFLLPVVALLLGAEARLSAGTSDKWPSAAAQHGKDRSWNRFRDVSLRGGREGGREG